MNNSPHLTVQPEVTDFVAKVRARLGDLTDEEREELVGGLEADLSERLEDVGPGGLADDLGDPFAYAAELRAAAGLDVRGRRARRPVRPLREDVDALLDAARVRWDGLVGGRPRSAQAVGHRGRAPSGVVGAAGVGRGAAPGLVAGPLRVPHRPAVAGCAARGPGAVAGRRLGERRAGPEPVGAGAAEPPADLGPGRAAEPERVRRADAARAAEPVPDPWTSHAVANGEIMAMAQGSGLQMDGRTVGNVFAYDSTGKPLTGVQLYDAKGRPLSVTRDRYLRGYDQDGTAVWTYPWYNGSQPLLNVFPLPVRRQESEVVSRRAWDSARPPALPPAPLAVVPPVALPTPDGATSSPSATPSARLSAGRPKSPSARTSSGRSPRGSTSPSPR